MDYTAKPVFMFSPNWDEGVLERLEWLTDVMSSQTGAEQRISKRLTPRRGYELTLRIGYQDRQFFDNMMMVYQSAEWLMPLWQDVTRLTAPAAIGDTTVFLDTTYREFVAGGFAIIKSKSALIYEVVKIQSVAPDSLSLISNNVRGWPAGSYIYPAASGVIDGDFNLTKQTDVWMDINMKLAITDRMDYAAAMPALQYLGLPVLNVRPDESDDLSNTYSRIVSILDGSFGKRKFFDAAGKSFVSQAYNWAVSGRDKNAQLRSLLYAFRGRVKPLWLPTFMQDFTLVADISSGDSVMTVKNSGFSTINVLQVGRQDVRIEMKDGTVLFKRILAYSAIDDDREAIGFDSEFTFDITPSDVRMISFMGVFRLDSDSIEINHDTDTNGLARVAVSFKSNPAVRNAIDWTPPPFTDAIMNNLLNYCACNCSKYPPLSLDDDEMGAIPPLSATSDDWVAWFDALPLSYRTGPTGITQTGAQIAAEIENAMAPQDGGPVGGSAIALMELYYGGLFNSLGFQCGWGTPEEWQIDDLSIGFNYADYTFTGPPLSALDIVKAGVARIYTLGAVFPDPSAHESVYPEPPNGYRSENCLQIVEGAQEQFSAVAPHHVSQFRGAASVYAPAALQVFGLSLYKDPSNPIDPFPTVTPKVSPHGKITMTGLGDFSIHVGRFGADLDADTLRPKTGDALVFFSERYDSIQTGSIWQPEDTTHIPNPDTNFEEAWAHGVAAIWFAQNAWPATVTVELVGTGSSSINTSLEMACYSVERAGGGFWVYGEWLGDYVGGSEDGYTTNPRYDDFDFMTTVGDTVLIRVPGDRGPDDGNSGVNPDGSYFTNDDDPGNKYRTPLAACGAYHTPNIFNLAANAEGANTYTCSAQDGDTGEAVTFGVVTQHGS